MVREEADGASLKSKLVRETSPGIFPFHVKVFPQGFFPSSALILYVNRSQ